MKKLATALMLTAVAATTVLAGCQGCSKTEAVVEAGPPPMPVKRFTGLGVTFEHPDTFKAEVASDNPDLHQVAVGPIGEAGIQLVLRHNPKQPNAPLDLEAITNAEKKGLQEGHEALVTPSKLKIGDKEFEARTLKATILGFPQTDVIAVPEIGGKHYLLILHASDDDMDKAKLMFDKVLSTIKPG